MEINFEWYDIRAFNISDNLALQMISLYEWLATEIAKQNIKEGTTLNQMLGKEKSSKIFLLFNAKMTALFEESINSVIDISYSKTDRLNKRYNQVVSIRNSEAVKAFMNANQHGISLSGRIWNLTKESKTIIETELKEHIKSGRPSRELAKILKENLKDKTYAPKGKGIHTNPIKNAQRVAVTEVNMAYREADYTRWQSLPFVTGIEVRLSRNKNFCPFCKDMQGIYPKAFKFIGWHPRCRCRAIPILATLDNAEKYFDGNKSAIKPIKKYPEQFNEWMKSEIKRENEGKSVSWIFLDNKKGFK